MLLIFFKYDQRVREDRENTLQGNSEDYKFYKHSSPDFSLNYPKELKIDNYKENEGETIVFTHPRNSEVSKPEGKIGFQIYITPFDDGEALTRERILKDLPEAVIEEPLRVVVNPSAPEEGRIQGLIFWSASEDIGRTRELWFIHGGFLYEITTYAHLDEWLAKIMDSFRFKL